MEKKPIRAAANSKSLNLRELIKSSDCSLNSAVFSGGSLLAVHVTGCEAQLWDVSQQNAPWESLVTSWFFLFFFIPSTFDRRETDSLTQLVMYRSDERHFHTFRKGRKGLFGGLVLTLSHGVCCVTVPLSLLPDWEGSTEVLK